MLKVINEKRKLKEIRMEEELSLRGIMVHNDRVPMSFQAYYNTSSGKL